MSRLLRVAVLAIAFSWCLAGGALAEPDARMSAETRARSEIGAAIFGAEWQPAPNVSEGVDGLGPLYNAASCAACHGGPPRGFSGRVLRLSLPDGAPDSRYGHQLQDRAIPGHAPEGRIAITEERHALRLAGGAEVLLSRPVPAIADPAYGPPAEDLALSLRVPPPLDGLGFVAAIDEADIRALADPDDRDGDGVSGRAGETVDPATGKRVLARFGWKASVATLAQQTAEALHLDMGISSPRLMRASGDCTPAQVACIAAPNGASAQAEGAEISGGEIALLVDYIEGLERPFKWPLLTHFDMPGTREFRDLGCTQCHTMFTTARESKKPHLARQGVDLFSDLLLHDMGEGLADHRREGSATGSEWRTAPLWGLGRRLGDIASGAIPGLLHDGRARTIEEAILWHGGEAAGARDAYMRLDAADRARLIGFLARL